MKRLTLLIALIFAGLYLDAHEDGCSKIQDNWKSDKEAILQIEKSIFLSNESVTPDANSWLTSAHYYSCNGESGYLIIKSEKKTFIHQNVPVGIWNSLKEAKTIGGYYNFYIKNNYKLEKKSSK